MKFCWDIRFHLSEGSLYKIRIRRVPDGRILFAFYFCINYLQKDQSVYLSKTLSLVIIFENWKKSAFLECPNVGGKWFLYKFLSLSRSFQAFCQNLFRNVSKTGFYVSKRSFWAKTFWWTKEWRDIKKSCRKQFVASKMLVRRPFR